MAPRNTRSKAAPAESIPEPSNLPKLTKNENEQRRLFILPRNLSPDARIATLPHPVTNAKARYLFCPDKGLYEFSRISAAAAAPTTPHSWLITGEPGLQIDNGTGAEVTENVLADKSKTANPLQAGYVLENADLFVATPIDPLFLLMKLFIPGAKTRYRTPDDYLDELTHQSEDMREMLRQDAFEELLLRRLKCVSEPHESGDYFVFRPVLEMVAPQIIEKARRIADPKVWPSSMEEAFVKKQLEIPIAAVVHTNPQLPTPEQSMTEADGDSKDSQSQSQEQDSSGDIPESDQAHVISDPNTASVPENIKELMRIRVSIDYILSSYVDKLRREPLKQLISSSSEIDFSPLDKHLEEVQKVKAEVQALRSISDNISRKRGAADDDEAAEARAEKKRRKEEEEKKKKAESRATKDLKKADTSGMKKLSSFFTKAVSAAK